MAFFQTVPPAPGRPEGPGAPPPAQPATPAQPIPEKGPPPSSEAPSPFGMMLPVLLMFLLLGFMFWSTRSQQKKQAATLASLTKGDRVVTQSGLVGKLVEVGERYAKVEISPGVKIEMLRSGLVGKDTGEAEPKKKD